MPVSGTPKEIVHQELHKFKHGQLHSGSEHGPLVKNRPQAIAIALSEARRPHRAMGGPMTGTVTPMPSGGFSGFQAARMPMSLPVTSPSTFPSMPVEAPPAPMPGFGAPNMAQPQAAPQPSPSMPGCGRARGGHAFGGLTKPPAPSWTVRNEARSMLHSGPISSIVPGRTDRHNVNVGSGAYVLPADHVSALGQNNTKAGHAILNSMFGGGGPYGAKAMALKHGAGAPRPPALRQPGGFKMPNLVSAGGGKGDHAGHPVPIVVAGGEYTIPVEIVAAIGHGAIDPRENPNPTYDQMIKAGHKSLDEWVISTRDKHVKTLQKLPGPAKA